MVEHICVDKKTIEAILSVVASRNPYPDGIFIEPSKTDWAKLDAICRLNGLSAESFMGSVGRTVWINCLKEIKDSIDMCTEQNEVKPDYKIRVSNGGNLE